MIYNWWSWYCRAAKPDARMEAITSRPSLLARVGRAIKHAGQYTLHLTAMHAAGKTLMTLVSNIRLALAHVSVIAEQLPSIDRWHVFLNYVASKIARRPLPNYTQMCALESG
ncbi:MAG: hypothetical protein WCG35_02890 [Betaproteobacteria bacterium]